MARTKNFKFRISPADRRMIRCLAIYFRRNDSEMVRQLIAEAALANSIIYPIELEEISHESVSFDKAKSED